MGGMLPDKKDVVDIAYEGVSAINLLNETQREKRDLKYLSNFDKGERKNLLEEQLASKRAAMGAMGLSSSDTARLGNEKIIKDYQKDLDKIDEENRKKLLELANKKKKGLLSSGKSVVKSLIK